MTKGRKTRKTYMRIAMIGQKGIPAIYGGIESHVEELSKELAQKGHNVLVYARKWYTPENIKNYKGIKIVHAPSLRSKRLDAITHTFLATLHAIRQKPDIIHYHGVGPSLLAWIPRLLAPRVKVVCTCHCLDRYHQKWGAFAKFMLRLGERAAYFFPHKTIVVSKTIHNYYLNEYQKQTDYIPNGVATVAAGNQSSVIEDKWNLTSGRYLLMVSRLVRHKGAHYLLDAWQMARQQNPDLLAGYKLVIAGGSTYTDSYVAELKRMARGDNSVIFTDWQSGQSLEELFANCALFVHPSENEGLPISVLQAMSYGRPALVSDIPEHKEIIMDSDFWFSNGSIVSLADKITELISNKKLLEDTGKLNRKLVQEKFNWPDITDKTERIYANKT